MIANKSRIVNILTHITAILATVLLLAGLGFAALKPFVINQPKEAAQLRLLPSDAWGAPGDDGGNMLLKLAYIRGMVDALSYTHLAPKASAQVLPQLSGMDLNEVAAAVDAYYAADPKHRRLPPAAVLMRILPDQRGATRRSGLPALDAPAPGDSWINDAGKQNKP